MSLQLRCKHGWVNINTSRYFRFENHAATKVRKKKKAQMVDAATYRKCMRHRLVNSKVVALLLVCFSIITCLCENALQGKTSVEELSSVVKKSNSRKQCWNWTFKLIYVNSWLPVAARRRFVFFVADGDVTRHRCSVNAPLVLAKTFD